MYITVNGMADTQAQFQRIIRGIESMSRTSLLVGSRLPYAYGQETGSHRRSGKLARRAGGVFFLERAKDAVLADAERDIAEGLTRVTAPGAWVIRRLAKWVRRLARANAPVGTDSRVVLSKRKGQAARQVTLKPGRLRKSIHIERASGGRI